jgi:type II secretory pathway pseudopilin PulG
MTGHPSPRNSPAGQRGAALLVILAILGIAVGALLFGLYKSSSVSTQRQEITSQALAQAKDALLGYAMGGEDGGTPTRPGSFPCPDTNNDGSAEPSCSDGAIGRLPWKTLKIPELFDGSGAPLWYALSGSFRSTASIINSDSKGTLQVRAADGATLVTPLGSEAVAILFAPGPPLAGQSRATAAEQITASNYLDAVGAISNATGAPLPSNCSVTNQGTATLTSCPTFIAGDTSSSFNDQLLVVTGKDFMPAIEKRAAKVMESALSAYFATCGFYPRPADFANTDCLPGGNTNNCLPSATQLQGRFPYYAKPNLTSSIDWVGLPNWFLANRWDRVAYYAVGTGFVANAASQACPANCLTVDTDSSVQRLFFMPGVPAGNANGRPSTVLTEYLENAENTNLDTVFATPTGNANDLLFQLPRPGKAADTSTYTPLNPNPACVASASSATDLGQSILDVLGLTNPPPGGDTGQSSITLPDGTVISTGGTTTITVTNQGTGVDSGTGSPALTSSEALFFTFPTARNKLALYVNLLNTSERADVAFYNGGTLLGSTYVLGCNNAGAVFNNVSLLGSPAFTGVRISPHQQQGGGIYLQGIQACAGTGDCSITGTGAAVCAWP